MQPKILLVGNYEPAQQESMLRFGNFLLEGLRSEGLNVELIQPAPVLGLLPWKSRSIRKWLGYVDQYLFFIPRLFFAASRCDLVHICDHSNALYLLFLGRSKSSIVTCHDVLAIRSALGQIPENAVSATGKFLQSLILKGLTAATHIVCDTKQTEVELRALSNRFQQHTSVIPISLNYPYRKMDPHQAGELLRKAGYPFENPFFFHVGGNQWYKNRLGVIRLFDKLRSDHFVGHKLVFAGKPISADVVALCAELEVPEGQVVNLGPVDNETLRALYSSAAALIFPSLAEGFGWPVIEAQACGCPVVTSNREPMLDVSGGAAILVDPDAIDADVRAVIDALQDPQNLINLGLENVHRFQPAAFLAGYEAIYLATLGLH